MSSLTRSPRFLGLDLQLLGRELRSAWQQIQEWPVWTWLSPAVPVRLLRTDGQAGLWRVDGFSARVADGDVSTTRFAAVELPEDDLLLRRMELPLLPAAEVAQAVALEVAGASPFPADDLAWGYVPRRTASGNLEIQIALASRKRISSYLQALSPGVPEGGALEVWAMAGPSTPVVFSGFGETRRLAHAKVRQRAAAALLVIAMGLITAIAVTPVAQARLRAMEAQQASDELTKRVEPLIRQRAVLLRNVETGQALQEILADRADPLLVMDLLTRVLPDDTSLLGLNVQGSKVSMLGSTSDAAALMQQLSTRPELRDVKAPTPATRPLGTSKDSFNIEFTMAGAPRAREPPAGSQAGSPSPATSGSEAATPVNAASQATSGATATFVSPLSGPATAAAPAPQATAQSAPAPAAGAATHDTAGATFGGPTIGAPSRPAKAP